jgi:predicted metal-dependent phosphoesterase TrpH
MIEKLASFGVELDAEEILRPAIEDPRRAAGRPWIARAMVSRQLVATTDEAFERWLATGRPAFVPRTGASPEEVVAHIHQAGGVASIAHPGLLRRDEWLPALASAGLDALEAYHSEHDDATTARYLEMANTLGLAVSGGSDFHGDPAHGPDRPGAVSLPPDRFESLVRRKATT